MVVLPIHSQHYRPGRTGCKRTPAWGLLGCPESSAKAVTPGIRLSKQPKSGPIASIAGGGRQREVTWEIPVYGKRATQKSDEAIELKQKIEVKAGK
jgi:hypothetical protein